MQSDDDFKMNMSHTSDGGHKLDFLVVDSHGMPVFDELVSSLRNHGQTVNFVTLPPELDSRPTINEKVVGILQEYDQYTRECSWVRDQVAEMCPEWDGDIVLFAAGASGPLQLSSAYPNAKLVGWFSIPWCIHHFPDIDHRDVKARIKQRIGRAGALLELEMCHLRVFESPASIRKIPRSYSTNSLSLWPISKSLPSVDKAGENRQTHSSEGLRILGLRDGSKDQSFLEAVKVGVSTDYVFLETSKDSVESLRSDDLDVYDSLIVAPDAVSRAAEVFQFIRRGIPVIVPDLSCYRQWIIHGESGMVYAPFEISSAISAIERLACDDHLRKRLGQHGAQVHNSYTVNQAVTNLILTLNVTINMSDDTSSPKDLSYRI